MSSRSNPILSAYLLTFFFSVNSLLLTTVLIYAHLTFGMVVSCIHIKVRYKLDIANISSDNSYQKFKEPSLLLLLVKELSLAQHHEIAISGYILLQLYQTRREVQSIIGEKTLEVFT